MHYQDRTEAGEKLAAVLAGYAGKDVVVYALPRGGVPVAVEVAKRLHAPLDLAIVRKVGHPEEPEYAVCAVAESGRFVCDEAEHALLDPAWLQEAVAEGEWEAKRRRAVYLGGAKPLSARGRVAILVDDGIATGLTMLAAVDELAREHPAERGGAPRCRRTSVSRCVRYTPVIYDPRGIPGRQRARSGGGGGRGPRGRGRSCGRNRGSGELCDDPRYAAA